MPGPVLQIQRPESVPWIVTASPSPFSGVTTLHHDKNSFNAVELADLNASSDQGSAPLAPTLNCIVEIDSSNEVCSIASRSALAAHELSIQIPSFSRRSSLGPAFLSPTTIFYCLEKDNQCTTHNF